LRLAISFNPLFILHGGDLADKGTADELAHFIKVLKDIPDLPPFFMVRGNHEKNTDLYEETIGPLNFTIDNKRLGFRLVAVDNAHYALAKKELDYLTRMLDQTRPIQVVSMHIPPRTDRWKEHAFDSGKSELLNLMKERKVNLGLFAHIHMYDMADINGIPCIISGGSGADLTTHGTPGEAIFHIIVVEIKRSKVSYKVIRL
jgi:predicted phosphodiesterase